MASAFVTEFHPLRRNHFRGGSHLNILSISIPGVLRVLRVLNAPINFYNLDISLFPSILAGTLSCCHLVAIQFSCFL